jgi:hypothetical protein
MIFFRHFEDWDMPSIPTHLQFLAKPVERLFSPPKRKYSSFVTVPVRANDIEQIVAWARTEIAGESIVECLIIKDFYDFSELTDLEIVELRFSDKDLNADYDEGAIYDYISDCSTCARKAKIQTRDCGLNLKPKSDIICTFRDTIIVSDAARDVLARFGIQFRPITNRQAHSQVVTPTGYELAPAEYPTNASLICPECQRFQVLLRIDLLEGEEGWPYSTPKLSIKREQPVTIKRRAGGWEAIACDTPRMGRFTKDKNSPSDPDPAFVATKDQRIGNPVSPVFLRADVAAALDAAGIKGLKYLPVHISD